MTTLDKKGAFGRRTPQGSQTEPLDLAYALRPAHEQAPSRPDNPTWPAPYALLGATVAYVLEDGRDAKAVIRTLRPDGTADLNVTVGRPAYDQVYQIQVGSAPLGHPGDVGTWHEVDLG